MNYNNPQRQRPPGGPPNGYGFQGTGWGGGPPQPFRPSFPPSRMAYPWGPNPRQNFGSPGGLGFGPGMNFNNTAPPLPPEAPSSDKSETVEKDVKNEIEPPAPGEDASASQRKSATSTQQAGKIMGYPPPGYFPPSFPRPPWGPSVPYMPSYDQYQYNYNCVPPTFSQQQPTVSQPQQANPPGSGKKKKKKKKGKNQEVIVQFGIVQPPLPPGPPPPTSTVGPKTASNSSAVRPPSGTGGGKTSRTEEFWPPSLREYVSKCYSMAQTDLEKDQVEIILKGKITKATQEGTISSKDWSQEPLPSLLGFKAPSAGKSGESVKFNKFQIKGKAQLRTRSPSFRRRRRSSSRSSSGSDTKSSSRRSRSPEPKSSNFVPLGSNRISPNGKLKRGALGNREGRGRGGIAARIGRGMKRGGPSGLKVFDRSSKKRLKETDDCDSDGDGSVPYFWTQGKRPMTLDADLASTEKRNKRAARFADRSGGETAGPPRKKAFNLLAQINTTLYQSDNFEENTTAWENLHIVGTCQDLEKRFLRLTSAPESHMVRPVYILKKSLEMVISKWKQKQDYHYTCDQLKSIRQDLTVQGIRDEFTIKVYETHARVALEKCDTTEFNQCQSQLKMLYHDIGGENRLEFTAYRILYYMYTKETLDLTSVMAELTDEDKKDLCIDHALKLRTAWSLQNFHRFFRLYLSSPKMSGYLIDWFVERERKSALRIYIKSYRPSVPVNVLIRTLAFSSSEDWAKFVEPFGLVYSDVSRMTIDLKGCMACLPAIK